MQIFIPRDKVGKEKMIHFRRNLYHGDPFDVSTAEFVPQSLLFEKTAFVRSGTVIPLCVTEGERILATAVCFAHKNLSRLALGCFEALPNEPQAVSLLLQKAREIAREMGLEGTVIGLSAHISYGVGIQTEGFFRKTAFDSVYNKPYYAAYFSGMPAQTLSSYRGEISAIAPRCPDSTKGVVLRFADLRHFETEAEIMRRICDATIGKTYLYYPTQQGHFYELIKDLLPFLRGENLIFAEQNGKTVGFLFWHPDFNQMLQGGKYHSTVGIGLSYLLHRQKIDTAILNAIGSENPRVTCALLAECKRQISGKYRYLETTFVWDGNRESAMLNRYFFEKPYRRYAVYLMKNEEVHHP